MKDLSMINGGFDRSGMTCIGCVTSVDSIGRTLRVKTMGTPGKTDDLDLPFVRILHGQNNGQGDEEVNIPRINTIGVVLFVGSESIWLGALKMDMSNGLDQQTNQEQLLPGDWIVKTNGGNYIYTMVGGAIQVVSTDQCRTYWLPSQNLINSVCENWELQTAGGSIDWSVDDNTDDATLSLTVWDNTTPNNILNLNIGSVPGDTDSLLMLDMSIGPIAEDSLTPSQKNMSMQIGNDGNIKIDVGPGKATLTVAADGTTNYTTNSDMNATVAGSLDYQVSGAELKMGENQIAFGAGGIELLLQISNQLDKIGTFIGTVAATHTHIGNLAVPTLPPTQAPQYIQLQADLAKIKANIDAIRGSLS